MEVKELSKFLDEIFVPLGFHRKGLDWTLRNQEISKVINLQKSQYGTVFYINYGYVLNNLELTTRMHVYSGLGSIEEPEQKRIMELLDSETKISPDQRYPELKQYITDKILKRIQSINTEEDVLSDLKKRPHLNDVPLVVKEYFNLL